MATEVKTRSPKDAAAAAFEMLSRQDLSRADEIWAEDCVDHFLAVGDYRGRDEIVAFFREIFAAMPDFKIEVEQIREEGDTAIVQWRMQGTFSGDQFQGIDATGGKVDLRGVDVMTFEDGLIKDNTVYSDGAAMARQLGVLPPEGSIGDRAAIAAANAKTRAKGLIDSLRS